MKTIFGVNSATPINKRLKNGYTLFDWIMRQKGFPEFCMRTLCGEDEITAEEIEFLRTRDCKIGLVIRDLTETEISGVNGIEQAIRAVSRARELGAPENADIAIFAEINPEYSINHNWMISFAQTISANGYVPGFIANTDSSKNFNFDRQCSHFIEATESADCFGALIAATEPKIDSMPETWEPYCPSAMEQDDIALWMCGTTTFDALMTEDVYAKDDKVLEKMW